MAFPRITFNSRNADFTKDPMEFEVLPFKATSRIHSTSKAQTLLSGAGFSVRAIFTLLRNADATEAALKTQLFEASTWASEGKPWTLARDSSLVVNTLLDGAVLADGTSIPVASATGIVSGSRYVIESESDVAVVLATNTGTDPVTISPGVNVGFPSGSRFRYFEFLPMLGTIEIIEKPPLFYEVHITGIVDRSAL